MDWMLLRLRKTDITGRDKRQTKLVGQFDKHALGGGLFRQAVALQFDIKTVAEGRLKLLKARAHLRRFSRSRASIEQAARPSR